MTTDTLATRIAGACKVARMSLSDLAGISGIDVHQLINGDVTLPQVDQIAHITGTDFERLATR
jgi:hypothetical protein